MSIAFEDIFTILAYSEFLHASPCIATLTQEFGSANVW